MKANIKKRLSMALVAILTVGLCFNAFVFAGGSSNSGILGAAGEFNLFILEDATMSNSDSEGRVAVGGSANFSSYGFNSKEATGSNSYGMIVGGQFTVSNAQLFAGNLLVGGTVTSSGFNVQGGSTHSGTDVSSVLDFAAEGQFLRNSSDQLAALQPNGTTKLEHGSLILTGTDPDLNVFEVQGNITGEFILDAPLSSTVIINMRGSNISLGNSGYFGIERLSKNDQTIIDRQVKVIFNFPDATLVTIGHSGIEGTVLAPRAHLQTNSNHIDGTLIGKSINGHIETHHFPFTGSVPPASTPTPTETDAQPTPTATSPTETDAQPTPTASSPTETDAQPTPTASSPTETDAQPTPTATSPTETDAQPTPTTSSPTETDAQPTPTASSPTETDAQPTPTASSPTETDAQPTPTATSPTETDAQPTPTVSSPTATSSVRPTSSTPPPTETALPTATTPPTDEDEIIDIEDEEIPSGTVDLEDGSESDVDGDFIEIDEDEIPQGSPEEVASGVTVLPKTGQSSKFPFYAAGLILIGLGLIFRNTAERKS